MKNYSTTKPRASTDTRVPVERSEPPETIIISDNLPRILERFRSRWEISSDQKSDGEIFACWMQKKLETCQSDEARMLIGLNLNEIVADISPYCENKGLVLKKSAAGIAYEILIEAYSRERNIRDLSECIIALFTFDSCLSSADEIILDEIFLNQIKLFRVKFSERYGKFKDTEILICWMIAVLKTTKDERAKVLITVPIAEVRQNIVQNTARSEIRLTNVSALMLSVIVGDRYEYTMTDYDFSQYAAWLFEENFRLYPNNEKS